MNTEKLKWLAEPLAAPNGADSNASWWDAFHRAANPATILELIQQLEQERKRLDWALKNEAVYYCWGNVWRLCFNGTVPGSDEDIPTTNPRATIDELMEKAT